MVRTILLIATGVATFLAATNSNTNRVLTPADAFDVVNGFGAEEGPGLPLPGYAANDLTSVPSRDEIMLCAQNWVDRKIPYCQCINNICCGSCPYCSTYRCDCSGYVAYCTKMAAGRNTNSLAKEATLISKSALKKGDFINCPGKHVVFFAGWTDSTQTKYVVYQEPGCSGANKWAYKSVTTYPNGNNDCYKPYRRNGLSATALTAEGDVIDDADTYASPEDLKEAFLNTPYFATASNSSEALFEMQQVRDHGKKLGYMTFE